MRRDATCSPMRFLLWLRKSKLNKAGTCPIMLRVFLSTHDRAEHATGLRCKPAEWGKQKLKGSDEAADAFNRVLKNMVAKATLLADRLQSQRSEDEPPIRPVDIVEALAPKPAPKQCTLLEVFAQAVETHYAGKPSTKVGIVLALKYFQRWPPAQHLTLATLTTAHGRTFAAWLATQDLSPTTRRSYLGNLSSLLSRINPDHPAVFNKTGRITGTTAKPRRALTIEWIRTLQRASLQGLEAIARDLFMMQFFLHGSRVAAVIALQKCQIDWQQNRVRFTAMKVSRQKDVELRAELRELVCRYVATPGPFLLPLLPKNYLSLSVEERHRALTLARMSMRSALSRVGKKIGWEGSLHSHLARHSLALRAFQVSGGLELPKDMLGHAAISQTSVYIESISPERLDTGAASVYDSLL